VNGQVHYVALTIDDQTMNVDTYYDPQSGVAGNEVDVAFQLDGDSKQTPYNVWLDGVNLSEW
jgi:hypothetical protein